MIVSNTWNVKKLWKWAEVTSSTVQTPKIIHLLSERVKKGSKSSRLRGRKQLNRSSGYLQIHWINGSSQSLLFNKSLEWIQTDGHVTSLIRLHRKQTKLRFLVHMTVNVDELDSSSAQTVHSSLQSSRPQPPTARSSSSSSKKRAGPLSASLILWFIIPLSPKPTADSKWKPDPQPSKRQAAFL